MMTISDLEIAQIEAFRLAVEERRQSRFGCLATSFSRLEHERSVYLPLSVHAREAGVSPKSLLRKARKTLHRERQQARLATLGMRLQAVVKCVDELTPKLESMRDAFSSLSNTANDIKDMKGLYP